VKRPATPPPLIPAAPPPRDDDWLLPAVRGVQATREFFVAMVKIRDIPRLLIAPDAAAPAGRRAQRALTKARVPKIAAYLTGNPRTYTLGALTGAIDALPTFEPAAPGARMGMLRFPRETAVAVLDGQHRRAAIEAAFAAARERRQGLSLADESVPVTLYVDAGLERAQQQFADLNRHAVRPSGSLGLLYDHRDPTAAIVRDVVAQLPVFARLTDTERTACSERSPLLFTLSGIHAATHDLLSGVERPREAARALALAFWGEVIGQMPDWRAAAEGRATPAELRATFIHAHGVALHAIGRAGRALVGTQPETWRGSLGALAAINWLRSNAALWEGRALVGGRMRKGGAAVTLTANALKLALGLPLGPEELWLEEARTAGRP
jgi:DNA sulfur modification protein DndB